MTYYGSRGYLTIKERQQLKAQQRESINYQNLAWCIYDQNNLTMCEAMLIAGQVWREDQ